MKPLKPQNKNLFVTMWMRVALIAIGTQGEAEPEVSKGHVRDYLQARGEDVPLFLLDGQIVV